MENIEENITVKPKRWTRGERKPNYHYLKTWRDRNRDKYLLEKKKLNDWNKYKKIYLNILLE